MCWQKTGHEACHHAAVFLSLHYYWQLLHAADRFVVYDDVNYIRQGSVNRNRILINSEPRYLTIPLDQPSQHKLICDTGLQTSPSWRDKLVKMIEITYRKAPGFTAVFPVIESIILHETDKMSLHMDRKGIGCQSIPAQLLRLESEIMQKWGDTREPVASRRVNHLR